MNKTDKFLKAISSNIVYILLALVCIIYPLSRLAKIVQTGQTPLEILASTALSFFFGLSIAVLWGEKGTENGLNSKVYLDTKDCYNDSVENITPNIEKIDKGCDYINDTDKKKKQTVILKRVGLSYEKFIKGEYDNITKKQDKIKYNAIQKARKVKDIGINSIVLLSECESDIDGKQLSETIAQHKLKNITKKLITKIPTAIIFGLYTIKIIEDFSWMYVIWGLVEVLLYLLLGFINYLNEYNYIITKRRQQMILKIDYIYLILNLIKSKPELFREETIALPREDENKKSEELPTQIILESVENTKQESIESEVLVSG